MVEVVDPCLPGVQVLWWDPFGAAVFALSRLPTTFLDEAVIGPARQREFVDVGFAVVNDPAIDVVDAIFLGHRLA